MLGCHFSDWTGTVFPPPPCFLLPSDSPVYPVSSHIAEKSSLFSEGWAQLTQDPWVLSTVTVGFKLEFIDYPPFQRHIPPNVTMDALQFSICDEKVNALIIQGAVVEAGAEVGYISRYFLVSKKGPNNWRLDLHINALELLAALKSLECFTSSVRDCTVTIEVDNSTAVSSINRLGGCRSKPLCSIAFRIANWCEDRNLTYLNTIFVPGVLTLYRPGPNQWSDPVQFLGRCSRGRPKTTRKKIIGISDY